MRWPWEPKPADLAESNGPIRSEEVEKVQDQLKEWQRRLDVVESRIKRPPTAAAR